MMTQSQSRVRLLLESEGRHFVAMTHLALLSIIMLNIAEDKSSNKISVSFVDYFFCKSNWPSKLLFYLLNMNLKIFSRISSKVFEGDHITFAATKHVHRLS